HLAEIRPSPVRSPPAQRPGVHPLSFPSGCTPGLLPTRLALLEACEKTVEQDASALVGALADELMLIVGGDAENKAAAIYRDQLGCRGDMLAYRRGGEVANVYECADCRLTLGHCWLHQQPGCVLHQPDHCRSAEYLHTARTKGLRRARLVHHQRRFA